MAALVAVANLAGCADDGRPDVAVTGTPSRESRASDEYWLVIVAGEEAQDPSPRSACDVAWSQSIHEEDRSIEYAARHSLGEAPRTIIATAVWRASDCPYTYAVTDSGRAAWHMPSLGDVEVRVVDDGTVHFAGVALRPGQTAVLRGEGRGEDEDHQSARFTGEVTVRAVGAWPHSGLQER